MGQVVPDVGVDDLSIGTDVEVVLDTLYTDDDTEYVVWKWRPISSSPQTGARREPEANGG